MKRNDRNREPAACSASERAATQALELLKKNRNKTAGMP
jgi:hypothetical protein